MSMVAHRTFTGDFRKFFLRGLAVLLPSVLTVWIIVQAYQFVDRRVADPINRWVRMGLIEVVPYFWPDDALPAWYVVSDKALADEAERRASNNLPTLDDVTLGSQLRADAFQGWWDKHAWLNVIGLILAVVLFYLAGRMFGGFLGRRLADRFERIVRRVPLFKQVYPYVKQIVDFVVGEAGLEFSRVGLVEYPRKGVYALAFITGKPVWSLPGSSGRELVTLFVPSSPTPFTGYTITLPRAEVVELDLTVDEALRFTVSGGVLNPQRAVGLLKQRATRTATSTKPDQGRSPEADGTPNLMESDKTAPEGSGDSTDPARPDQ